ncbi:Berberine/berberine-like [Parasponia andersonii]|uniref:Berberine/berberine-like n=1 Tax=Parasponia andersonii TaxID=3476 RepID=A0A2P5A7S2_PARAD|nr:Berberine/berberine-like [Parasponia andersonii]
MVYIHFFSYGGRTNEISESEIPFPHRAGNLFHIVYFVSWEGRNARASKQHLSWITRVYRYMTPNVSKNPRAAYFNYRDLQIGTNNKMGTTSYAQASIWGTKYFDNNFKSLFM